ncbi:hypothetical protein I6U48_22705 [Clostridium sp. PL3]|uniref:Uncharacterized protein n=1 Tax=Clostridium thailandense TaxID=2794346 RepID=A0A949TUT0_9CLOT|nr:hypothetical protein [Clostridium thailandense]MBV7275712.1 hypothetical protein [Clostridium thailandense]
MDKNLFNSCTICGGKGFIIKHNSSGQDTIIFCTCREIDKTKLLWKVSGIEKERNRLTFGSYKPYNEASKKAKGAAIAYFKNFNSIKSNRRNSIAFLGQVGSGNYRKFYVIERNESLLLIFKHQYFDFFR